MIVGVLGGAAAVLVLVVIALVLTVLSYRIDGINLVKRARDRDKEPEPEEQSDPPTSEGLSELPRNERLAHYLAAQERKGNPVGQNLCVCWCGNPFSSSDPTATDCGGPHQGEEKKEEQQQDKD